MSGTSNNSVSRRNAIMLGGFLSCGALVLAGCGSVADVIGKVPVKVELPPELQEAVNDVMAIVKKVEPIANQVGEVSAIVTKAKEMVSTLTGENAGGVLSQVASWMSPLVSLVKPYSGTVATAIATLLPMIGGTRTTSRTGMSPAQARMILRS